MRKDYRKGNESIVIKSSLNLIYTVKRYVGGSPIKNRNITDDLEEFEKTLKFLGYELMESEE